MYRIIACSAALAVAVSAGLVRADQKVDAAAAAQQGASAATAPPTGQPNPAKEAAEESPVHAFVMDAHNDNVFEIGAGQLAQERAQSGEVKRLAQMLIADHQKADAELKKIAGGMGVTLTDEVDQLGQLKLQKLKSCPSADFDRKYVIGQTAGHTMDVLEFTYQAQHADNGPVKQFATQTLPRLQEHLEHAARLARTQVSAGQEAQPAAGRIPAEEPQQGGRDSAAKSDAAKTADSSDGSAGRSAK